jgi:hypothetical protein
VLTPPDKRPITAKWVFKYKVGANSKYHKQKIRLVARVYEKQHDINFDETFTLVIKWGLIKSVISTATHHGWGIHQLDVKMTFLNGNLQEEVYMW